VAILGSQQLAHPIESIDQVVEAEDLASVHRAVREVHVDDAIRQYIVDIVSATRVHPDVYLGASPRGSLGLYRTAQASALMSGRDYVIPDDVKPLVEPVLAHRVIMNPSARVRNVQSSTIVEEILRTVTVPGTRVPA
jgi:MoxR-like ATPase